jgi:hypothetical protein
MLEVPANYFGKGRDYNLSDDPKELQEFERKFKEWEAAHPDDPVGEKALSEYESTRGTSKVKIQSRPSVSFTDDDEDDDDNDDSSNKIRLELPSVLIMQLKRYARFHRKRPRDIVMMWIIKYGKL